MHALPPVTHHSVSPHKGMALVSRCGHKHARDRVTRKQVQVTCGRCLRLLQAPRVTKNRLGFREHLMREKGHVCSEGIAALASTATNTK